MTTEIMTTEASEEMTTEEQTSEAPVMQRADVCGDVTGKWRSIHTPEQLTLTLDSDDNLGGMYSPCPNCGWSIVSGRKAALKANLGFMAIGQHGDVVTSWTGQVKPLPLKCRVTNLINTIDTNLPVSLTLEVPMTQHTRHRSLITIGDVESILTCRIEMR